MNTASMTYHSNSAPSPSDYIALLKPKVVSLAVFFFFVFFLLSSSARAETAFDRVVRTNTLRCGYNFWEPGLVLDEKKKQLWGFYFDVMSAFEKESGIKVVWDHVVDWGMVQEELKAKKIDAMCAMWNTTAESRYFLFSRPFAYQGVEAIVRADDPRFDKDLSAVNQDTMTIAVVDNATQDFIARSDFPNAKRMSMPLLASNAELLASVQARKADMTFTNPGIFAGYDRHNKGLLKRAAPGHYIRLYGNSITLDLPEKDLANLLNISFSHLVDTGEIDAIVDKYNHDYTETFLKVAPGFKK